MRIDAYSAISQIQATNKVSRPTGIKKTGSTDKVEISQIGKDYQVAKKAVAEAPDVRMDLVNDIKERINNGSYYVSDESLADKIIDRAFAS